MRLTELVCGCLASAGLVLPAQPAMACGPDFPPSLFASREAVLATLVDGDFQAEAMGLLPAPSAAYQVVEGPEPDGARRGGKARETKLYDEGAAAFHAGDHELARRRFQQVLDLPGAERRRFSTFAAYMLGRLSSGTETLGWFQKVRSLVGEGFDDPLGLALASLGEEARWHLERGEDLAAIRLYAEQASYGSGVGATSLLFVCRALVADPQRLEAVLADPLAQRLLSMYAWTRGQESWWQYEAGDSMAPLRLLERLGRIENLQGADRLAAAAYRRGRFDIAERFANKVTTPLAWWVRAKLALRAGDLAGASEMMARAQEHRAPEFEGCRDFDWPYQDSGRRLAGERAVLALVRGKLEQAMDRAIASCYWLDVAYLAERVLTLAELEEQVTRRFPDPSRPCPPESEEPGEGEPACDRGDWWGVVDPGKRLRNLLARRLLRAGAYEKALDFFDDQQIRKPAQAYAGSMQQAQNVSDPILRAQHLFEAALLARRHGMEILGYETAPDWAWIGGEYDLGEYGFSPGALGKEASGLWSPLERERLAASQPSINERFHYRALAADLAEQAAALLPRRSQAWAMCLCHAARFVSRTDPERMQGLWQTYLKQGAMISGPFFEFGASCPTPDFERARHLPVKKSGPILPHLRKRTWAMIMGGTMLAGGVLLWWWIRRRRIRNQGD